MTTMRPTVRALVLGAVLVGSLTACGPNGLGLTGVTVDGQGAPVIVLAVCQDQVEGAGILDTGLDGKAYRSAGSWVPSKPVGQGLTLVPVASPPPGWTQERPPVPLVPRATYVAQGSTADNTGATDGVDFTVADLEGLAPGTVLYQEYVEVTGADVQARNRHVAVGDFLKVACG